MTGYISNGDIYSLVDSGKGVINFFGKGRNFIGQTCLLNKDIKAIGNYQSDTLKLINKAWGQPLTNYKRAGSWFMDYDFCIENNIVMIYKRGVSLAAFRLFSDNIFSIEFFLDHQFRLIERYIHPQRGN